MNMTYRIDFFWKKKTMPQRNELFFDITQRIEPLKKKVMIQRIDFFSFTLRTDFFSTTHRIEPFFFEYDQRIEPFSWVWRKELNPLFLEYDAINWTVKFL